ncbi:MAG TPA: hypothetical protein PLF81_32340, partial [Candidatus Anammoximicrobium sp.]|nr:hypothetical protein [Candidatus Anammoximicrobium sp.]
TLESYRSRSSPTNSADEAEMHPQLWPDGAQTTCEILRVLERSGRRATDLDGNAAARFDYGPYILEPERRLTGSTPAS